MANTTLTEAEIYHHDFVERLFDEMSGTYERVNLLSSFGFSNRWRRQLVERARLRPGGIVVDLMCGMGECWRYAMSPSCSIRQLIGIDRSSSMLRAAATRAGNIDGDSAVSMRREDALATSLPDASVDCVICGFGLKTLSAEHRALFADEVYRVLKPGGSFSMVEISVPVGWPGLWLYMFYLKWIIPLIGWLLLGNPENYRLLGIYTERFVDARGTQQSLDRAGLVTHFERFFFGCATGVSGYKPA